MLKDESYFGGFPISVARSMTKESTGRQNTTKLGLKELKCGCGFAHSCMKESNIPVNICLKKKTKEQKKKWPPKKPENKVKKKLVWVGFWQPKKEREKKKREKLL